MRPTRIVATNGCGFVFIPLQRAMFTYRQQALINLTIAAKYDLKLQRQVGISIAREGQEILIDFCFLNSKWEYDQELDENLTRNNPFAPMTKSLHLGYDFYR